MVDALLEARAVKKYFPVRTGTVFSRITGWIKAVDGLSFSITRGETLGLAGESGCGKTTMGRLILRMENLTAGSILFEGRDVHRLSGRELREHRGAMQLVFQDPYSSLDPRMRVGDIVAESLAASDRLSRSAAKDRVAVLLDKVGLNGSMAALYPHEFSGGQRQRIAIARALAPNPRFVVLDEPVSALDVSIRAQILNLLMDLQERFALTYLLVAHDLAVVEHMCTRLCIMYLGRIVEHARTEEVYGHPLHPYTALLLSAALPYHPDDPCNRPTQWGEVGSALALPAGCRFAPRCTYALSQCREAEPPLAEVAPEHWVACHLVSGVGPAAAPLWVPIAAPPAR